jgi:Protein of unknown function (DUF3761)
VVLTRKLLLSALTGAVTLLSAAALSAQTPATICKDGTTSASSGRGACSGHGGVGRKAVSHQKKTAKSDAKAAKADAKADKSEAKAARSEAKEAKAPKASATARAKANTNSAVVGSGAAEDNNAAGAIARCKDGLYSHAKNRRGACSRHGGVASWI